MMGDLKTQVFSGAVKEAGPVSTIAPAAPGQCVGADWCSVDAIGESFYWLL